MWDITNTVRKPNAKRFTIKTLNYSEIGYFVKAKVCPIGNVPMGWQTNIKFTSTWGKIIKLKLMTYHSWLRLPHCCYQGSLTGASTISETNDNEWLMNKFERRSVVCVISSDDEFKSRHILVKNNLQNYFFGTLNVWGNKIKILKFLEQTDSLVQNLAVTGISIKFHFS